ncbi:MAG: hypothetical protein ACI9MR_005000 [Myxococcota bacterium]|jgi:hypothetical protein
MAALAATDVALPADVVNDAVRERVFWLSTLMVLIFAYTTFETFFRARDLQFMATLPIRGRTRYYDLLVRALIGHLPLLLPVGLYGVGLFRAGLVTQAQFSWALAGTLYLVGIPLCTWLHLLAGRSLLGDAGGLKRHLASGLVADEAAALIYAPAAGLLITLVCGIFVDLTLRDAFFAGKAERVLPVLGISAAAAVAAAIHSGRISDAWLHRILPRFSELDVPPPFRDDGVKKRIGGEQMAAWLPAASRPYFVRDLRQLRRRFRLDKILLWVFGAALIRLNIFSGDAGSASVVTNVLALGIFVGVFLGGAFRVRGRELASPWLEQALPIDRGAARLGRLSVDLIYPCYALAATTVSLLVGGAFVEALWLFIAGAALVVTLVTTSQLLAERAFPDRVLAAAMVFRALIIATTGVVIWQAQ